MNSGSEEILKVKKRNGNIVDFNVEKQAGSLYLEAFGETFEFDQFSSVHHALMALS